MASKDEYYQKIITTLQSDITQLKSALTEQQLEIESLKISLSDHQLPTISKPTDADINTLLSQVKEMCDDTVRRIFELLPGLYANKEEFEKYRQTAGNNFETFKKSLETRLKTIEEKLSHRNALFAVNHHTHIHKSGTGPDQHPPTTPTFWANWRNVILCIVGAAVFAGCFLLLNTINDNRHLREEKQLLYNTIELLQHPN